MAFPQAKHVLERIGVRWEKEEKRRAGSYADCRLLVEVVDGGGRGLWTEDEEASEWREWREVTLVRLMGCMLWSLPAVDGLPMVPSAYAGHRPAWVWLRSSLFDWDAPPSRLVNGLSGGPSVDDLVGRIGRLVLWSAWRRSCGSESCRLGLGNPLSVDEDGLSGERSGWEERGGDHGDGYRSESGSWFMAAQSPSRPPVLLQRGPGVGVGAYRLFRRRLHGDVFEESA